jgi:hypothetical protein
VHSPKNFHIEVARTRFGQLNGVSRIRIGKDQDNEGEEEGSCEEGPGEEGREEESEEVTLGCIL